MLTIKENEFNRLASYIKANYGIDLMQKKVLLEGRLANHLTERGFESFDEYINVIFTDITGDETKILLNKVTTNYTFFMREPEHFDFFKTSVLPTMETMLRDRDLRIWSAGCSSGEEPYGLAMIMQEYFGDKKHMWDTKVLATDISDEAIMKAKLGIYNQESMKNVSNNYKNKFFDKHIDGAYKVSDKIKSEVVIRKFNLMEEIFPFKKKFHIIFCRNVMIYFDQKTKNELINKFYDYTEPGGYLFIGHSEYINRDETNYKHVIPAVYRKI